MKKVHNTFQVGRIYTLFVTLRCLYKQLSIMLQKQQQNLHTMKIILIYLIPKSTIENADFGLNDPYIKDIPYIINSRPRKKLIELS